MVALPKVIASNDRIASHLPDGLVAVFVGGTSGVGEYTLKKFAKYVPKSRVYIIGRSQKAADDIIQECRKLGPDSKFEFIQADISLLKNVDDVCRQIRARETSINILFQSQGSVALQDTAEGISFGTALATHSRLRFILNLLPLVQNAKFLRRVVSVLAGTCEGYIDKDNLHGANLPLMKRRDHISAIQTLLLEETARRAPDVSFIHTVPGVVKGGISRDAKGSLAITFAIFRLLMPFIETPPAECGERHLFLATSVRYSPNQGGAAVAGVPVKGNLEVARGIDGQNGSGLYSVDPKDESAPPRVEEVIANYRQDGTAKMVWDSVIADLKRIMGT